MPARKTPPHIARRPTTRPTIQAHELELLAPARDADIGIEAINHGANALIVQDIGLLELDLPPIQLHASTQTDIRSPEKVRFLQDVGFSQIVPARGLTLDCTKSSIYNNSTKKSEIHPKSKKEKIQWIPLIFCTVPIFI